MFLKNLFRKAVLSALQGVSFEDDDRIKYELRRMRTGTSLSDGNLPAFQNGAGAAMVAGVSAAQAAFLDRSSFIIPRHLLFAGAPGCLEVAAADVTFSVGMAAGSFIVRSSSATDTSTFEWLVLTGLKGLT